MVLGYKWSSESCPRPRSQLPVLESWQFIPVLQFSAAEAQGSDGNRSLGLSCRVSGLDVTALSFCPSTSAVRPQTQGDVVSARLASPVPKKN